MITIELKNAENRVLAAASHAEEALLCVDRAYLPGDKIIISGGDRLYVRMDQQLPEGELASCDAQVLQRVTWAESDRNEEMVPGRTTFYTVGVPGTPAQLLRWLSGASLGSL